MPTPRRRGRRHGTRIAPDDDQVRRPLLKRPGKAHWGRPLVQLIQGGSCMAITRKEFLKLGTLGLVGGAGLALSSAVGAKKRPTRTVLIKASSSNRPTSPSSGGRRSD